MCIWLAIPVVVPTGLLGLERLQQVSNSVFGLLLYEPGVGAGPLLVVVEIIIVANFGDVRSACCIFWVGSELFSGIRGDFGRVK